MYFDHYYFMIELQKQSKERRNQA